MIKVDCHKEIPSITKWFSFIKLNMHRGAKYRIKIIGNSMLPTYENGSYVIVQEFKPEQVKVGDIIVYKHWSANLTVHRIVDIIKEEGKIFYQTKGDNNICFDNYLLSSDEVIGVVVCD